MPSPAIWPNDAAIAMAMKERAHAHVNAYKTAELIYAMQLCEKQFNMLCLLTLEEQVHSCDKQTYDTAVTMSKNGVQNKFALWCKNFRKADKASLRIQEGKN